MSKHLAWEAHREENSYLGVQSRIRYRRRYADLWFLWLQRLSATNVESTTCKGVRLVHTVRKYALDVSVWAINAKLDMTFQESH